MISDNCDFIIIARNDACERIALCYILRPHAVKAGRKMSLDTKRLYAKRIYRDLGRMLPILRGIDVS